MDKLKPRAVIFDLGSTLIEYESISWSELGARCAENGRKYLVRRGVPIPEDGEFHQQFEQIKTHYRETAAETLVEWTVPRVAADLLDSLQVAYDDELIDSFFEAFYKPVDELLYIYDDTIETLERLQKSPLTVGLISNTIFPESAHRRELKRFGIAPYLSFTIFSSTFKLRKPHPDIFLKAANLAGCAPSECVYIGDRYLEDIQGPTGVGMPAILKVKVDREYPEQMPEATRRIGNLLELFEHITY